MWFNDLKSRFLCTTVLIILDIKNKKKQIFNHAGYVNITDSPKPVKVRRKMCFFGN